MRTWISIASLCLLLAGCTDSSGSESDDCAYGGCVGDINPDISGWDLFGPWILMLLAVVAIGSVIYLVVKKRSDDDTTDDEAEQP